MRPKNRVWGFSRNDRDLSLESRRRCPEPRRKPHPTPTIFAPGIPQWPSWDPIEEEDGINLYGFVANSPIREIDTNGLYTLKNSGLTADQYARVERLAKELEVNLEQTLKDIDFITKCIAGQILEGKCADLKYGRKMMVIGSGLANLLNAKRYLQNVLNELKGTKKLTFGQKDLGTDTIARNVKPLVSSLRNDRIELNTNSKGDWRKKNDEQVSADLLHELVHEANQNSGDSEYGITYKNAEMYSLFSGGRICETSALNLWIHADVRETCCDALRAAEAPSK